MSTHREVSGARRETIREQYAAAAGGSVDPLTQGDCARDLYFDEDLAEVPEGAAGASLGCANPLVVADLHAGEVVLDLGSGGGLDVLLSARRVGPAGKAFGLDMTDEMVSLAQKNQREAGIGNAEFLKGHIEAIPLPSGSVDVILSNCVINLSDDKPAVFREMHRVLRNPGRIAIADLVAGDTSSAGACGPLIDLLTRSSYRTLLEEAGFEDVSFAEIHPRADGCSSVILRALKK